MQAAGDALPIEQVASRWIVSQRPGRGRRGDPALRRGRLQPPRLPRPRPRPVAGSCEPSPSRSCRGCASWAEHATGRRRAARPAGRRRGGGRSGVRTGRLRTRATGMPAERSAAARGPVRGGTGAVRSRGRGRRRGRRLRVVVPELLHLAGSARHLPGGSVRPAGAARARSGRRRCWQALAAECAERGLQPAGVVGAGLERAVHRASTSPSVPVRCTGGPCTG